MRVPTAQTMKLQKDFRHIKGREERPRSAAVALGVIRRRWMTLACSRLPNGGILSPTNCGAKWRHSASNPRRATGEGAPMMCLGARCRCVGPTRAMRWPKLRVMKRSLPDPRRTNATRRPRRLNIRSRRTTNWPLQRPYNLQRIDDAPLRVRIQSFVGQSCFRWLQE